jgi:hypothetical protein
MYGTNVEQSYYFSSDEMFVDVFMHAGAWWTKPTAYVPLTPHGYPASGTATTLFQMDGYPSGNYKFYGEGDMSIAVRNAGAIVPGTLQKNGNVTTALIHFDNTPPANGVYYGDPNPAACLFDVTVNDPNNPPDNFHLIHPDYPAWPNTNAEFTKDYLKALSPFTCLRVMDWMGTNNSTVSNWSDRPDPVLWGDGNRNDAYERFIELANATNCDLWVSIPAYATDDWAQKFATLLTQNLNPNLHVYYEYSNECWNWGFSQWQQIETWAQSNSALTAPPNSWERHNQEVMFKLVHYVQIMQPILASRGRPIFAGQLAGASYTAGAALDWLNTAYGQPSQYIFGISGASYFYLSSADPNPTTLDELFVSLNDNIDSDMTTEIKQYIALAQHYNVQFTCYESGQSLYTMDQTDWALFDQAQFDPRMGQCYQKLGNILQANGTYLNNFYNFIGHDNRFGWWGALNDVRQITANVPVKYQAQAALALAGGLNDGKKTQPSPPGNNNPPGSGSPGNGSPPSKHSARPPKHSWSTSPVKGSWPISPGMGRKMSSPTKINRTVFTKKSIGKQ